MQKTSTEQNIIHQACKEFGVIQKELASMLGVSIPTIERWAQSGKVPKQAQIQINLLLENRVLKNTVDEVKIYTMLPKHLQKRYYHLMMADLALIEGVEV